MRLSLVIVLVFLIVQCSSASNFTGHKMKAESPGKTYSLEELNQPRKEFVPMKKKFTWFKARKHCELYGMSLATIKDAKEQKKLELVLTEEHGGVDEYFWVAGYNIWNGWVWRINKTDEPMTYKNWKTPETANLKDLGQCLLIHFNSDYKWINDTCENKQQFICEAEKRVSAVVAVEVIYETSFIAREVNDKD